MLREIFVIGVETTLELRWFCFTTLCDWTRKLVPPSKKSDSIIPSNFSFSYDFPLFLFIFFHFSFTLFSGIFICFALQDIYNIFCMRAKDRCDTTLPAPDGPNVTNKPAGKRIPYVEVWKVLADVSNN